MSKRSFHPEIQAIIFCEFHAVQGARIIHSVCNGSKSIKSSLNSIFELVSEYLIPKSALCGRLISLKVKDYKLVGYPVMIKHSKYPRNVAVWNLVFVFDRLSNTLGINSAIIKISKLLHTLEVEYEYITSASNRHNVFTLMQEILMDLNDLKGCRISINSSAVLNLKLSPIYPLAVPNIQFWNVPIATVDLPGIMKESWDLTLQRIIPYINGISSVSKIAQVANADIDLVILCLQHLARINAVQLVDIFQTSNIYVPTSRLRSLSFNAFLQQEAVKFVKQPNYAEPTCANLLSLYAGLKLGLSIREYMTLTNFPTNVIDIRRFVVFGVLKGLIQRVHKYPIMSTAAAFTDDTQAVHTNQMLTHTSGSAPTNSVTKFRNAGNLSLSFGGIEHYESRPSSPPKFGELAPGMYLRNQPSNAITILPLDAYCILWKMSYAQVLQVFEKQNISWIQI